MRRAPAGREEVVRQLAAALEPVRQDRWSLAVVENGLARTLADSGGRPPAARGRPLSFAARRCLFERRPLALTAVGEGGGADSGEGWEAAWPATLHVPVTAGCARPVGLLTLGCRDPHWYTGDEIEHVARVAGSLEAWVSAAGSPLRGRELETALLLSEGASLPELASALRVGPAVAQDLAGSVMKKLAVRSRREIVDALPAAALAPARAR